MRSPYTSRPEETSNANRNEADSFLIKTIEEKPIWTTLRESIHDRLFPDRRPTFEMTSTPIPVADRMATRTNPWAVGTSTIVNGGLVAFLILMGLRAAAPPPFPHHLPHPVDLSDLHLIVPKFGSAANGGGRSGANELVDPLAGNPRFERARIVIAQVPLLANPQLAINSSIAVPPDIKLPDDPSLPNIGVHNSTNITLTPSSPGGRNGFGTGPYSGDGPGGGNDHGPGFNGIGTPGIGGVSNPVPLVTPEAEFSDEARRQKYQGACLVTIIVDSKGNPQNPRIARALGMGLDEKALEAVRRYRFKPAMKDGKPVPVMITVEVNFRLY
jgi:protein TonB